MAKIGEILIQKGLITSQQLEIAMAQAREKGEVIGKTLIRLNFCTEKQLLEVLGEQLVLPFYPTLKNIDIPQEVIDLVPVKYVWHYKFMPLEITGKILTIAISDPLAIWSMEDLKLHLGYDIDRVLAVEEEILSAIRRYYGFGADTVDRILEKDTAAAKKEKKEETAKPIEEIEGAGKDAQEASVINLVNQILLEAISGRATDIHIEPYRDKVRVRYRIDGIMYDINISEQVKLLHQAMVSRIKILSNLNVVEKRLPQDGRAIIKLHDKQIDLRISIIPSIYGESVVIRILPTHLLFNLEELGFYPNDFKQIEELMQKPHGIIFLTGPTGSGKTTTLYACLSRLNKDTVKIITIEDPVEYDLSGIMQIQIKPEIGFSFANALRSILRHDPDIMMIGEVRDLETAELSIRTALTGHLIFSTLHTNDAASGATRLIDIGIEPYLVASSVNAFISQRLVRMICPKCKTERKHKDKLPEVFNDIRGYYGKGCDACKSIGYRGRTTIYEIFPITNEVQDLILNKASSVQIQQKAKDLGFKSLWDVGLTKIKDGITTAEEVLRVTKLEE